MQFPVLKLSFKQDFRVLTDALAVGPAYESHEFENTQELLTYVADLPATIIICALSDKNDLVQLATLVKLAKKTAPNCTLKIVVVNFSGNKQFEKAVGKLGILDLVETNVSVKALRYKIDFWMKSLKGQVKNLPPVQEQKFKTAETKSAGDKSEEKSFLYSPALDCESDIWLLSKESDCKKILSRWMVKLIGPSPYVANWVEVPNKPNFWKFDFKASQREEFLSGPGDWFFVGSQKPDYIWKENKWLITGEAFDLFFMGETQVSRLNVKNKIINVTENSEFAKTKESIIIGSFDKEMVFKKSIDQFSDDNELMEGDGEVLKNLAGKGKTSQINNKNLSGKSDGTDNLSSNPYGLDLKPEAKKDNSGYELDFDSQTSGPLKGKSKTDQINDEDFSGPAGGAHNNGKLLDMENKKQTHETHYKGHNEAEKFEASEKKKNQYSAEEFGDLGGKTSTDHLSKHYKNSQKNEKPEFEGSSIDHQSGKKDTGPHAHYDHLKENARKSPELDRDLNFEDEKLSKRKNASIDEAQSEVGKILAFEKRQNGSVSSASEAVDQKMQETAKVTSLLEQGSNKFFCDLDDFFDDQLIFKTDFKGNLGDEKIKVSMNFEYGKSVKQLDFLGQIFEFNQDEEGSTFITVTISEKDASSFETFMDLYKERQKNITNFLKEAKGY